MCQDMNVEYNSILYKRKFHSNLKIEYFYFNLLSPELMKELEDNNPKS